MKATEHTVLIVDDDEDQRFFIERTFKDLHTPFCVQSVNSGEEAIAYLKGDREYSDRARYEFPAYIITDLNMSQGDGFHVLQFLRDNPALSVVPVVMLSTSNDEDDIRQAYLLGASSYFVKPNGLPALRILLKKIHEYWTDCEVPRVDAQGYALPTDSRGKRGERYAKPAPRAPG